MLLQLQQLDEEKNSPLDATSRMPCFVNENWSLFRLMKLVFISINEIHPRIKHLPINKLRGT